MYTVDDILPANRDKREKDDPNPVYAAFMQHEESVNFSRDEVRELVIPVYMGLISQVDHHVGRIVAYLKEHGLADNTIIIMTSDHGDYLGDHWLGEKDLYHEESVRIPLIVVDPSASADVARGTVCDDFVEAIDLAPTFLDWAGGAAQPHRLEGRSIRSLVHGKTPDDWRDAVFCDGDFSVRPARLTLGLGPSEARGFMVRTARWKYVLFERNPPQLFDLEADPNERNDLGRSSTHENVRREMEARLFTWMRQRRLRTTLSDDQIVARTDKARQRGYIFGAW
jgi:arylsulfatase A-like enzyme